MSVADILEKLAENAGRPSLARGALIANTIASAAAVPGQILDDREKERIRLRQQAQQEAVAGYARNADARATKDQALQDAAAQRDFEHRAAVAAGLKAAMGDSGDPTAFDGKAAFKAVADLGKPEAITDVIAAHRAMLPKLTSGAPGSVMRDEAGAVVPNSAIPEKKPDYTINGQRFSGDGTPLGTVQPPQPAAAQTHNMRVKGVGDVPVDYVPKKDGSGGTWMYQGKDVSADVTAIPSAAITIHNDQKNGALGDFSKTGDEFLATIPVQWRATVKKIANYDEDPTKVASMRGGNREMLTQWVNQVNPAYDASLFTNRAPTRKAFTTGAQGREITAMNTTIGHLDQLTGLVEKLGNGAFTPGNKVWNNVQTIFGSDKVTNFDTLKDVLASEVAKTLSGGVATVDGIKEQRAKMNGYSSPDQLAGYVKTVIPTMGSKLAAHNFTYHQAMGENDTWSALSPASKAILTKFGFDPEHPEISGAGATGTIRARDPQGVLHEAPAGTTLPAGWTLEKS